MSMPEQTFLRMPCQRLEDRAGIAVKAFSFARRMGFDQRACWEIGIAVQELVSNVVRHGGGGYLELYVGMGTLEVIALDTGPGIPTAVMEAQGFWSRGLGAVRRLMHELEIDTTCASDPSSRFSADSAESTGTRVYARRYKERP
jgi:anti-sigma regulatory factor (Ser/Thr protein kinase)